MYIIQYTYAIPTFNLELNNKQVKGVKKWFNILFKLLHIKFQTFNDKKEVEEEEGFEEETHLFTSSSAVFF